PSPQAQQCLILLRLKKGRNKGLTGISQPVRQFCGGLEPARTASGLFHGSTPGYVKAGEVLPGIMAEGSGYYGEANRTPRPTNGCFFWGHPAGQRTGCDFWGRRVRDETNQYLPHTRQDGECPFPSCAGCYREDS